MPHALLRLTCSFLVTLVAISVASAQVPAKYALLIAVSQYPDAKPNAPPRLKFAEADAKALGASLQGYGYEVDLLLGPQATQKAIREKLDALSSKSNGPGVVVVGLWGCAHSITIIGTQYMFCPFDTSFRQARDFDGTIIRDGVTRLPKLELDPEKCLELGEVLAALDNSGAGNRVLLADCIPHIASRRDNFGENFNQSDVPINTAALFSAVERGQPLEHEPWGHGAFTKCLLDLLPQLASKHEEMPAFAARLKATVERAARSASNGQVDQTVYHVMNGAPDLLLSASNQTARKNIAPATKSQDDQAPKIVTSRTTGTEFVLVPGGTFAMGSTEMERHGQRDETLHQVTISRAFYLGKFEVTQAEFQRVMGFNPSFFTDSTKLPVEQVSWFDAVSFCNRLSELDGRSTYYRISDVTKVGDSIENASVSIIPTCNGYRLPTEAEWEYACRAGTSLPFHFGANITAEQVNYNGHQPMWSMGRGLFRRKTVPGDAIVRPNKFGLVNMHGNVWEWCWDWRADYPSRSTPDPTGPNEGLYRVLRGGSWVSGASYCRSAYRSFNEPKYRTYTVGFRVAINR